MTVATPTSSSAADHAVMSVCLVSATQNLSARLPEVLAGHRPDITVIGAAHGQLKGSPFIRDYQQVAAIPGDLPATLESHPGLLDRGAEWVLFDDDGLIRALAESAIPDHIKRKSLPASTDLGLAMLGSKVGQQCAAESAGVATPRTFVATTRADVRRALAQFSGSGLIKGDVGGGGAEVWRVRHARDIDNIPRLDEHFPVVVQELVTGPLVSVEPLFRRGQLLGFAYSQVLRTMGGGKGPSTVRRYLDPPTPDVRETLEALGAAAGAHGFANATFIWCPQRRQHLLIELDLRINAWVQYGPRVGLDWGALMTGPSDAPVVTSSVGPQGLVIHAYPRALAAAAHELSWSHLRPWVRRETGTWDARNQRDPIANAAERASLIGPRALTRYALHDPLRATWKRLPSRLQRLLEESGWKRRGLNAMGIRT